MSVVKKEIARRLLGVLYKVEENINDLESFDMDDFLEKEDGLDSIYEDVMNTLLDLYDYPVPEKKEVGPRDVVRSIIENEFLKDRINADKTLELLEEGTHSDWQERLKVYFSRYGVTNDLPMDTPNELM
jgi:hypothetical protein